jgi:hypothetical protein
VSTPTKAELAQQALMYTCVVVEAKARAEAARAQLDQMARWPTEVEYTVRPAFDRALRTSAANRGAACDDEGTIIPGLVFREGGAPRGVSIRPAADAKTATLRLAGELLDAVVAAALEVPGV